MNSKNDNNNCIAQNKKSSDVLLQAKKNK